MGQLALALGEYDRGLEIADEFVVAVKEAGLVHGLADGYHVMAQAHLAKGQLTSGREALDEAVAVARRTGARRVWRQVLVTLADVEFKGGNPAVAANLTQEARTVLNEIIERVPEGELRDSFLALPGVQKTLGAQITGVGEH